MNSPYIPVRTETCTFIVLKPFPPPTPFPPAKLPRFYAKTLYGNNFPINRARYVNLIVNFTRVTSSLRVMHQPITLGRDNAFAICRAAGGMIRLESRNWESCPSLSKRQPFPKSPLVIATKFHPSVETNWNERSRNSIWETRSRSLSAHNYPTTTGEFDFPFAYGPTILFHVDALVIRSNTR